MVGRTLLRSSLRFYQQHPLQLLLSFLGIVLGVSIVTAVLITNQSSTRAFSLTTESLYGRTTHQIEGATGVPEQLYSSLRKQYGHIPMAPVIEGYVSVKGTVYTLIGFDPFAELTYQRVAGRATANVTDASTTQALAQSLSASGWADNQLVMNQRTLDSLQLNTHDQFTLTAGGRDTKVQVAGVFQTTVEAAGEGILIGDIGMVQRILNKGSHIDRIDLMLTHKTAPALEAGLPSELRLVHAQSRQQTMQAMTKGFQINLTAMSLLALVVGLFLIHNTMTFAVLQRRENYAIKRLVGVTSRMIGATVLIEAAIISLIASIFGIGIGYLIAKALIRLTTQTINDLYFVLHVQEIWFHPGIAAVGLVLGVGSSMLAASLAAIEAAKTDPINARMRSHVELQNQKALPWIAGLGLLLLIAGFAIATLSTSSLLLGFLSLTLLLIGYGCTLPLVVLCLSILVHKVVAPAGITASLAVGSVKRNISRTGIAIAALTIAVAATFGVNVMIDSFRHSVDQWLGTTLQSDLYLTAPSTDSSANTQSLSKALLTRVSKLDGIESISTSTVVTAITRTDKINMRVLSPHIESAQGFHFLGKGSDGAWNAFEANNGILISEPLATKSSLEPGESLELFTEKSGFKAFLIAGIYQDYGSSHGRITMHRNTYNQHWSGRNITSIGLMLESKDKDSTTLKTIQNLTTLEHQPVQLRYNSDIHQESLTIFDRTFEVTRVLRWLTVGVAVIGIFSALLALHLERAREFAVLRACGTTRAQILNIVVIQTVFMGLCAGLLALPLGWMMAEVLIKVINVRSFGWTMSSLLPKGAVIEALSLATISALLAGFYPAWKTARFAISDQLRSE